MGRNIARVLRPIVAAVVLTSCQPVSSGVELSVDVKTDLTPGMPLSGFRVTLSRGDAPTDLVDAQSAEALVDPAGDYETGVRIAELDLDGGGDWWVRVDAIDPEGRVAMSQLQRVVVRVPEGLSVVFVLARVCLGVECPADQTCDAGRCATPDCVAESSCPDGRDLGPPPDQGPPPPPDLGPTCPVDIVERFTGPAPCSRQTRSCVDACEGDFAFLCVQDCLDQDDHRCDTCFSRNTTECQIRTNDCQAEWDCYAACARERCLSPHDIGCWMPCADAFGPFVDCVTQLCPNAADSCFP